MIICLSCKGEVHNSVLQEIIIIVLGGWGWAIWEKFPLFPLFFKDCVPNCNNTIEKDTEAAANKLMLGAVFDT